MNLFTLMSFCSLSGGLAIANSMGEKADGIGLWVGSVADILAGLGVFLGFRVVGNHLLKTTPVDEQRRPTLREEFPFIVFYVATWIGIFISTVLVSWITRVFIHHVANT
ncbi:MAG: hypothetical protein ACLP2Y_09215 [Limisphaerales bacterium]